MEIGKIYKGSDVIRVDGLYAIVYNENTYALLETPGAFLLFIGTREKPGEFGTNEIIIRYRFLYDNKIYMQEAVKNSIYERMILNDEIFKEVLL